MKNQYFGDVNDYRKYGILRLLSKELRTCVCWMLTPDDDGTDGRHIDYLDRPDRYRDYDPELFELMHQHVVELRERTVEAVENVEVLPNTIFHSELLEDSVNERDGYFCNLWFEQPEVDLIFFDPDNGLEVNSARRGNKNSSKYLYYQEVVTTWNQCKSILIYQHFPREERTKYIDRIANRLRAETGADNIKALVTGNVVFFLLSQANHQEALETACVTIEQNWQGQVTVVRDISHAKQEAVTHAQQLRTFVKRPGMYCGVESREAIVAFVHGYEYGAMGECDITAQLKAYLEQQGIPYLSTGWWGQVERYAEGQDITWKEAFRIVLNQILDQLEPHERSLLECPNCGLVEDCNSKGLITYQPNDNSFCDTGLRFERFQHGFRCPASLAMF